jgi:hypothetical protein
MLAKNHLFFVPVLTPPPPPPPPPQIVFESRLGMHDVLNNCTMTVDGTDFRIPQKGAATKGNTFASHKYVGKSALRYELGVDILTGNLVWIQGPYPAGKYTDIKFFNKVLRNFLEPGERVEADAGQRRESNGESGDAGEGKGTSRDAKWAAEELGDPLPGLPPPHHDAWRCVPGVCGGDAAHHRER